MASTTGRFALSYRVLRLTRGLHHDHLPRFLRLLAVSEVVWIPRQLLMSLHWPILGLFVEEKTTSEFLLPVCQPELYPDRWVMVAPLDKSQRWV